jgi:hypothetical protein
VGVAAACRPLGTAGAPALIVTCTFDVGPLSLPSESVAVRLYWNVPSPVPSVAIVVSVIGEGPITPVKTPSLYSR